MYKHAFLFWLSFLVNSLCNAQQVDLSRFVDGRVFEGLNPYEYQKITFKWDLPTDVQIAMNEGLTAMDQERMAEAIPHFDKVIQLKPDFGPAYYYRSICRKNPFGLDLSESDMIKASNLLGTPECSVELGDIYFLKGNIRRSKDAYKKAIEANTKYVMANFKLGCLLLHEDNLGASEKYFNKCIELDPKFVKAYLQLGLIKMRLEKNNAEAKQMFTKAIAIDSTNVTAYFFRSLLELFQEKRKNSLKDLDKTVELAPANPYFRLIRGLVLMDLKEFDKAYNDLRKALNAYSTSEGKSQFGQTQLDKRIDLQNVSEYLNRAIYGLDERSAKFLKTGFCYLLAGLYDQALENFKRVSKIEKSACETYLRALTYEHMGQHMVAYNIYSEALILDPDIFDAHKKRAIYRGELKLWDEAYADLREMNRLQPGSIVNNRLSGFLYYNSGKYSEAIKELAIFLHHDSTDIEAIKVVGDSKAKLGDYKGAIIEFKKSIVLADKKQELEDYLITLHLHAGDTVKAVELLVDFNERYRSLGSEVWLAELYIETGEYKKAETNIRQLGKLLKDNHANNQSMSYVYYLESRLSVSQGFYNEALNQINKSLEFYMFDDFLYQRAKVFFRLNRMDEGKSDLAKLKAKGYKKAESFYQKYGV